MKSEWPTAELDPVRRLHVLAAGIPGAFVSEVSVVADPDELWESLRDLEVSVPRIQPHVRSLRMVGEQDGIQVADVRGYVGLRARMSIGMYPRFCCMQSRFLVIGMAVREAKEGAVFARLQGLRFPAPVRRALKPAMEHTIREETARVAREYSGPSNLASE